MTQLLAEMLAKAKEQAAAVRAAREEFDSIDDDHLDPQQGHPQDHLPSHSNRSTGQPPATRKIRNSLSEIASLILQADARAPRAENNARIRLAKVLGVEVDDLKEVVDSVEEDFGEGVWNQLVVEERTRHAMESHTMRSSSWDRIETLALKKLGALVESGAVHKSSELLAIASAANKAVRHTPGGMNPNRPGGHGAPYGAGVNIFMQQNAGVESMGDLPTGDLGTMTLQLSPRIQQQLARPTQDSQRVLANSKMLEVDELRALSEGDSESPFEEAEIVDPIANPSDESEVIDV